MTELSIIIVSYKNKALVQRVIDSIGKNAGWEVIVIDNSKHNRGFARACNIGAKKAKGEYLYFLNPDTRVLSGSTEKLLNYLKKHSAVGIVGPQLLDEDERPYQSTTRFPTRRSAFFVYSILGKWFPNLSWVKEYWYREESLDDTREVETISGAAMMMRKELFDRVKGFDEQFFLYWEDFDLSKKVSEAGMKVVYLPKAKVIHTKGGVTKKNDPQVLHWFKQARFRFFRKYFGIVYAVLAETFLTVLEEWRFVLALSLAAFLRFYRLPELMPLLGDQGRDFLAALEVSRGGEIPLLGIPSSVPRFKQGPIYVWFLSIVFAIFGPDPVAAGMFAAVLGLVAVGLTYILVSRHFGKTEAFLAALVLATSPLAVAQSRLAFHTNAIPLFSLIYLWRLWKKPRRWRDMFWVALSFGLLFQFELAVFPLAGLLIWYWVRSWFAISKMRSVGGLILGLLIGVLPQLIYDLQHSFSQLGLFLVWTGYRIVSFFGFDQEHALSTQKVANVFDRYQEYFSKFFSWGYPVLAVIFLLVVGWYGVRSLVRFKSLVWEIQLVLGWLGLILIAFVIHGGPSEAYFPVLFVPLAVVIGLSARLLEKPLKHALLMLVLLTAIVNSLFLVKHDFLISSPKTIGDGIVSPYGAPLVTQREIVGLIKQEAGGQPVTLVAKGAGAEFDSFLDNYRFLLKADNYPMKDNGQMIIVGDQEYFGTIIVPNTKFYTIEGIMVGFVGNL